MIVREAHPQYSGPGEQTYLLITETPLWAVVAGSLADELCSRCQHLFCNPPDWTWRIGVGPRDPDFDDLGKVRSYNLGATLRDVSQRLLLTAARRQRDIARVPVSDEFLLEHFPDTWITDDAASWCADEDS